jgi:hypothetical protein
VSRKLSQTLGKRRKATCRHLLLFELSLQPTTLRLWSRPISRPCWPYTLMQNLKFQTMSVSVDFAKIFHHPSCIRESCFWCDDFTPSPPQLSSVERTSLHAEHREHPNHVPTVILPCLCCATQNHQHWTQCILAVQ